MFSSPSTVYGGYLWTQVVFTLIIAICFLNFPIIEQTEDCVLSRLPCLIHCNSMDRAKKHNNRPQQTLSQYMLRSSSTSTAEHLCEQNQGNPDSENRMAEKTKTTVSDNESVSTADLRDIILNCQQETSFQLQRKLDSFEVKVFEKIDTLKTTIDDLKESLEFTDKRVDDLEKKLTTGNNSEEKMKERLKKLEDTIQYQEARSRKYNLLVYGIPKAKTEDIYEVIHSFATTELKLSENVAKSLSISNAHRIPRAPNNSYKRDMPDPIIIKFGNMRDRDKIYQARFSLAPVSRKTIRTDLPPELKRKRSELASTAFKLRKERNLKTKIVESARDVKLLIRESQEDEWKPFE